MKRTSAFTAAMTSVGVALFFPIVTRADPFVWGKTPTSIVTGRYSHGARPSFRIPWATPCLQYRRSESLQSVAIISDFPPQAESWRPQSILSKPGGVYEARAKIQTFGGRKEKDVTPQRSYLLGTNSLSQARDQKTGTKLGNFNKDYVNLTRRYYCNSINVCQLLTTSISPWDTSKHN